MPKKFQILNSKMEKMYVHLPTGYDNKYKMGNRLFCCGVITKSIRAKQTKIVFWNLLLESKTATLFER